MFAPLTILAASRCRSSPPLVDCCAIICRAVDNLKAGITKARFYDPNVNRTYSDLAAHYDVAARHCPRTNGGQGSLLDTRHDSTFLVAQSMMATR